MHDAIEAAHRAAFLLLNPLPRCSLPLVSLPLEGEGWGGGDSISNRWKRAGGSS